MKYNNEVPNVAREACICVMFSFRDGIVKFSVYTVYWAPVGLASHVT